MSNEQVANDYIHTVESNLGNVDSARIKLDAALADAKEAGLSGDAPDYNALQAAMYEFGSAARYFLSARAPLRYPSPSLSTEPGTPGLGRDLQPGETRQGGVV